MWANFLHKIFYKLGKNIKVESSTLYNKKSISISYLYERGKLFFFFKLQKLLLIIKKKKK